MLEAFRESAGLWRIPLPTPTLPPATTTNHYLVGQRHAVLVDPSTPQQSSQDKLVALLDEAKQQGVGLQALFLTHHHRDHVGATAELRARLQLPVWAHAKTAALLPDVAVDRLVADGETVAENDDGSPWQALHTPGHAPGHLVLWHAATAVMVAGDMVAGEGTILVDPKDGNMGEYLASLENMARHQPRILAPAHGELLHEAMAVLTHYRLHRLAREHRVLDALPTTWTQPDALLPSAYGDVSRLSWPIALRSLQSHLVHLAELGHAERQADLWRRIG
jgi:ribonuclease/clavin/mitogillin